MISACYEERHHPDGFVTGAVHGQALKDQAEDCRQCHGSELTGGDDAPSCDGCHDPAEPTRWRSDCTFCHGGVVNDTGAPPRNLDGTDQVGPFPVHTVHVTGTALAAAFDCTQCHVKAIDVLSPGHVFDDSPREAENDFGAGLSPQAHFTVADHSCSGVYCHGNGRADDGVVAADDGPRACDSCHPSLAQPSLAWSAMSGRHALHLASTSPSPVSCGDCHLATTSDGVTIASRDLHVDGQRQVTFPDAAFTYAPATQTCTGSCHGVDHAGLGWGGSGGGHHPAGYAAREVHGTDMELQRSDCRGCHGANLEGGVGPSCDSCHSDGWRDDCTFCHGNDVDGTGAPPQDLGSADDSVAQSFVAHTRHVTRRIAPASDCVQCHRKPTDVMSLDHAFDLTPASAEVTMTAGLSPAGTYNNGTGTCANLYCHGNGRASNGTYTDGGGPLSCAGCHPGRASSSTLWGTMSGEHRKHLSEGYSCEECHATVAGIGGASVIAPDLHVDGRKQVALRITTITYDPATRRCTGPCHDENHQAEGW